MRGPGRAGRGGVAGRVRGAENRMHRPEPSRYRAGMHAHLPIYE
ncbi:hypothetical protein GCM10017667_36420 [Streptomyces filamentosus]|uniref:Uncharacterized protein n=1 Tax=Streptomyces filamentosus TaxID=67294 RepID=A0A919BPV6_STRFL|nr:hypothetical protein GCM10017667_36420 [Streptomyces filamentosus]